MIFSLHKVIDTATAANSSPSPRRRGPAAVHPAVESAHALMPQATTARSSPQSRSAWPGHSCQPTCHHCSLESPTVQRKVASPALASAKVKSADASAGLQLASRVGGNKEKKPWIRCCGGDIGARSGVRGGMGGGGAADGGRCGSVGPARGGDSEGDRHDKEKRAEARGLRAR